MAELKEVFDMATKQVEPDQDSWKQQEQRQRRTTRNRRVGAIVLVAAMIAAAVLVVVVSRPKQEDGVGSHPSPSPFATIPPIGAQVIGLGGTPIQQVGGFSADKGLALSPDGTEIAFYSRIGGVKLVGVSGGNERLLTQGVNTNHGDAMDHVSWSPDGSELAYAWDGEIYVMAADGSHERQLTHTVAGKGSYYPVFSPDGSTIAYWSGSSTGQDSGPRDAEIYTIPATGGTPTRLTHDNTNDIEPTWSPDGSQIARFSNGELWVMRADGSGDHLVYRHDGGTWAPAWSPDGSMIAFLRYDPTERSVDDGPLMKLRVLTLATMKVDSLPVRVETDLNGPQWTTNSSLLVNRYD
jgi:Tol biopolymer transport system component